MHQHPHEYEESEHREPLFFVRDGGNGVAVGASRKKIVAGPSQQHHISPEKGGNEYDRDTMASLAFLRHDGAVTTISRKARINPPGHGKVREEASLFSRRRAAPPDSKHLLSNGSMFHWENPLWSGADELDRYVKNANSKSPEKQPSSARSRPAGKTSLQMHYSPRSHRGNPSTGAEFMQQQQQQQASNQREYDDYMNQSNPQQSSQNYLVQQNQSYYDDRNGYQGNQRERPENIYRGEGMLTARSPRGRRS
jgi:hypothetical protein